MTGFGELTLEQGQLLHSPATSNGEVIRCFCFAGIDSHILQEINKRLQAIEQMLEQQTAINTICLGAMFQKTSSSDSSHVKGNSRQNAIQYYESKL